MKRICLTVVTALVLILGGVTKNVAEAHGPPVCGPRYGGGYSGYRGNGGYGSYYQGPVRVYPNIVPYGAGYSGGWQPYQNQNFVPQYSRRPSFGFYFGY